MSSVDLIAVCGPNASGKTRLGVALALHYDGEIISVDSRQVYRRMDIGTGKDLGEYRTEKGDVPYHLIDIVEPDQVYTLWQYQKDFYRVFRQIRDRGKMPIAVGGTGLYLEAVLRNYRIPDVPGDERLREALMRQPKHILETRLESSAPDLFARTDVTSKKRIVRSLEIALGRVGRSFSPEQEAPPRIHPLVIGLRWDRSVLRRRIEERLDRRLEQGLVEEVRRLLDGGLDRKRLDMFGMEYRQVARFLGGEVSFEQMRADLLRDIGRLAKRQETYFRGMERRGIPVHWIDGDHLEAASAIVEAELEKRNRSGVIEEESGCA